ncbi:MAG: 6-phosphogluconate dehydrogenase (decarboxylating), partial [Paenibacillus sp.]|nr:6-phosphogluconate dehydrogenase (decarboxylating) [Paenibacillus sp.]
MKVGLIGLGKMGLNLGQNLLEHQHEVIAFDLNAEAVEEMKGCGAAAASSLQE